MGARPRPRARLTAMRSPQTTLVLLALLAGCGTTSASGDDAKSAPRTDVRVIVLEYTVPEEMAATLDEFVADSDSMRVVPHAASNSILVTGSDEEIMQLLDLVARLDVRR